MRQVDYEESHIAQYERSHYVVEHFPFSATMPAKQLSQKDLSLEQTAQSSESQASQVLSDVRR